MAFHHWLNFPQLRRTEVYITLKNANYLAIDNQHILHASDLTDSFSVDSDSVKTLVEQIDAPVNQFMADGAYDQYSTYKALSTYFPNTESIIPPDCNAIYDNKNHSELIAIYKK